MLIVNKQNISQLHKHRFYLYLQSQEILEVGITLEGVEIFYLYSLT